MGIKEEWKPVVGYEEQYYVSNQGDVVSLPRTARSKGGSVRSVPGKFLSQFYTDSDEKYVRVILSRKGKPKTVEVHVLMAEAFIGPRPEGMLVCHKDGDGTHNYLDNLRYDTPKGNEADKVDHGTDPKGIRNGNARHTEDQIKQVFQLLDTYGPAEISRRTGVSVRAIDAIKSRNLWSHLNANKEIHGIESN